MIPEFDSFRLLWLGDWSLGKALGLSLLLALIIYLLYRSEIRKGTTGSLKWMLPTLRCLAVVVLSLILAGPVLRLQKEEGNRGRITVFLDSSESMNLKDNSFSPGRKILLAKEHGFLPEESKLVDLRLHHASRAMKKVAILMRESKSSASVTKNLQDVSSLLDTTLKDLKGMESKVVARTKEKHLLEELWFNLDGEELEILFQNARYKNGKPDQTNYLSKAESRRNIGDRFGRKIRAFLKPPLDGEYKFWIFSDDCSLLRIAQPGKSNFRNILESKSHTPFAWSENLRSESIFLKAGKSYPVEMIHKEGAGDDFCSFGWTLPNGQQERPIPGERFSAPMSEKDALQNLPLSERIQKKIRAPLEQSPNSDTLDFELLSREAFEISALLEESFDRYADSLLDQNIIPLNEAIANFEAFSRMDRATRLLQHPTHGFLEEFKDTHVLEIRNLSQNASKVIWDNQADTSKFNPIINPTSPFTDLSKGILEALKVENSEENVGSLEKIRSAAVLITDGGHNQEGSPLQTAKLLSARNLPVFTVGLGSDQRPPDFAILRTSTPDSVYQKDRIRGVLSYKDHLIPGTPYSISIEDEHGTRVWNQSFVGMEKGQGQFPFDFPVEEIVERELQGIPESEKEALRTIPLNFKVLVDPIEGEAETANNHWSFSIDANMRKNQLLILDSRPRWETRYLNNLFERDDRWEVSCVWGDPRDIQKRLPRGDEKNLFPKKKEDILKFDLILYGEIDEDEFTLTEQSWLFDFVTQRGGGILFLDGPRQKLRLYNNPNSQPISSLLPVTWNQKGPVRLSPSSFLRPEESNRISALTLDPIKERNEAVWKYLPIPAWTAPVQALPGAEVFLEISVENGKENQSEEIRVPVIVGKKVGAGKSFYIGFDESWRWRYEVADLYHQRFWNQLSSSVMEKPFALNHEGFSVDAGGGFHEVNKAIPIRVRLRDKNGKIPKPPYPEVDALIWNKEEVVATIPLQGQESTNGLFSGQVYGLEAGSYDLSIRAPTLIDEMEFSEKRLPFNINEGPNQEKSFLTCDEDLLIEMADASGGGFFREENFHELKEVLRPISSGRIIINELNLWQSFGWLGVVVFLLGLEMLLRKRAGML